MWVILFLNDWGCPAVFFFFFFSFRPLFILLFFSACIIWMRFGKTVKNPKSSYWLWGSKPAARYTNKKEKRRGGERERDRRERERETREKREREREREIIFSSHSYLFFQAWFIFGLQHLISIKFFQRERDERERRERETRERRDRDERERERETRETREKRERETRERLRNWRLGREEKRTIEIEGGRERESRKLYMASLVTAGNALRETRLWIRRTARCPTTFKFTCLMYKAVRNLLFTFTYQYHSFVIIQAKLKRQRVDSVDVFSHFYGLRKHSPRHTLTENSNCVNPGVVFHGVPLSNPTRTRYAQSRV